MPRPALIATLLEPPAADGSDLAALPSTVEWLEVRADLVGDIDPDWLRNYFRGRLLYSLRSTDIPNRRQRLEAAARFYDRIDLEVDHDHSPDLLRLIPPQQRLVSWYGNVKSLPELRRRFDQALSVPAPVYKLLTTATTIAEEFIPLSLLHSLQRTDTIAYSNGPLGFWNRLVALQLGAPGIFGLATRDVISEMEPSIIKLIDDYRVSELHPAKEIFAIVGNPIFHSLSPRLHNASYRLLNHPALFVPLRVDSFDEFWREFVVLHKLDQLGLRLNGMTVASPHKEAAMLIAKTVSGMSRKTESANLLVRNNGWWNADTTDPDVIYTASHSRIARLKEKRAAVIGCGGAGRAIAAALVQVGASVTLINRGAERGEHAAALLSLPYVPLPHFEPEGYDIVVNATPVGRDSDEIPFKVEQLRPDAVVIDLVYGSRPTPLLDLTRERHQIAIDGREVLMMQVRHQFRMMTGKEMPVMQILDS